VKPEGGSNQGLAFIAGKYMPKKLNEEVARLHLEKIGVKLTVLSPKQAGYISVPVDVQHKAEPLLVLTQARPSISLQGGGFGLPSVVVQSHDVVLPSPLPSRHPDVYFITESPKSSKWRKINEELV